MMWYEKLSVTSNYIVPLLLCTLQTSDGDQHPLLDRAASQWPFAVAGQGPHTDGLSQHPLLQCVLGAAHASQKPSFPSKHLYTNHVGKLKRLSVIIRKETPLIKSTNHSPPSPSLTFHLTSLALSLVPFSVSI